MAVTRKTAPPNPPDTPIMTLMLAGEVISWTWLDAGELARSVRAVVFETTEGVRVVAWFRVTVTVVVIVRTLWEGTPVAQLDFELVLFPVDVNIPIRRIFDLQESALLHGMSG